MLSQQIYLFMLPDKPNFLRLFILKKLTLFLNSLVAEMKQWLTENPAANLNCFCFYLVYSKGRWCNARMSIEEKVYLIINVILVQWYNWCKSTAYRFLSQNSCSCCYCNFPYFCQPKESIFIAVDLGQQHH